MNVLLSIKPKYVDLITEKKKRYEFRKSVFRWQDISAKIYIYCSTPVRKIIGFFTIEDILKDHPSHLWTQCKHASGIQEKDFFKYFENKNIGYAIKIGDLTIFDTPLDPKTIFPNFFPPQSFYYIDEIPNQYS